LSGFSVRKPYTVFVAVVIVLMLGIISFMNMTTDLLPNIDLPYIVVYTSYFGASPEEVERDVTKPLEQTLATTSNVKTVSSVSMENVAIVTLEFYSDVNMDSVIIELDGKLDQLESTWGENIGSPNVIRMNPDALPIMIISVDQDGKNLYEISKIVNDTVVPEMEKLEGVASVDVNGMLEEQIKVVIDQDKIDILNDKILEIVEGDLDEAQEALDEAKEGLESGKEELAEQSKQGSIKLDEMEAALTDGKITIAQAETEIRTGLNQLAATQQILTPVADLLKQNRDALLARRQELVDMVAALPEGSVLPPVDIGVNVTLPEDIQLPPGFEWPEGLTPPDGQMTVEEAIAAIDEEIAVLDPYIAQIDTALVTIAEQIVQANAGLAMIAEKKSEVQAGEAHFAQGMAAVTFAINKATGELAIAEATLNSKTEEFDATREQVLEQASISGMVTPEMISQLLYAQNFSMPVGYTNDNGVEHLVKVGEEITSVEQLEDLVLLDLDLEGLDTITLKDVANVDLVDNADEIYARINNNDGVILSMQKQSMYSTADVAETIRQAIAELEQNNEGMHITTLMDQGIYINVVVDNVLNNLLYGAILAAIILLLFLRSIKPTIIVGVSIPISVVFALVLMYFSGVTLNVISLAGLALGVGMLVDNSIVAIENIFRLKMMGKSNREAAIEGAKQISGAIIASTLTTVSVFIPIVFITGLSRQLFADMGLTIAYSLIASLIVALTVVPAMSSSMLTMKQIKQPAGFEKFKAAYAKALAFTLRHKWIIAIPVVALFVLSVSNIRLMGTEYIPAMDSTQMMITLEMPEDSTFEETAEQTTEMMDRIITLDDVETVGALAGGSSSFMGMGSGTATSATIYTILKDDRSTTSMQMADIIRDELEDLPGEVTVSSSNFDLTALMGSGIEVVIRGDDLDTLQKIAGDIAAELEKTEGTIDVSDGMEDTVNEFRITVDKQKAIEKGFTVAQVYAAVSGRVSQGTSATTIKVDDKSYPVIVSDKLGDTMGKEEIENLILTGETPMGEKTEVKLSDIARVDVGKGLSSISRESQQRYISVTAGVDSEHNVGLVSRAFSEQIDGYEVPDGYSISIAGENQTIMDAIGDLLYMLMLAIGLVYLIMVAQFQSLKSPFIVMFTIPMAVTGGLLALQLLNFHLSLIAMLGFLVLAGIVVNNGIVLVDYINQLRQEGMPKKEAITEAARTRLRPILMTTLTTVFGLMTMALGIGDGAEMLQPMAIVTVFGLLYATLLTLFFIPILYDLFNRKELIIKDDKPAKSKPRVLYKSTRHIGR
jgi:multidrug efflux pump subunit AcrB